MSLHDEPMPLPYFEDAFEQLKSGLCLPETEETWERIFGSLGRLENLCQTGACEHSMELITSIRSVHRNITSAMSSERTRLSGAALDVLSALVSGLNTDFEPLLPLFLPALLMLCGRTNKVVVSRAKACIVLIIETTQLPAILSHLIQFSKDKSPTTRLVVAEGTLACLKCFNPPDLEKETRSRDIENIIRNAVRDANADIRRVGKDIFQSYKVLLPHRVDAFAAPLTPTIRKYLQLGASVGQRSQLKAAHSSGRLASVTKPNVNPISKVIFTQPSATSNITSGPVRLAQPPSMTTTTTTYQSSTVPMRSAVSIRPAQLADGSRERTAVGASRKQRLPTNITRPFVPLTKDTSAPQRVPTKAAAQSAVSVDGKNTTLAHTGEGPARTNKAPNSRTVSTSSSKRALASGIATSIQRSQPSKPLPAHSDATSSLREKGGSRDITRPTLSQLARTKPPVARTVARPVEKLNIRKTHSSSNLESGAATRSRKIQAVASGTNTTRPSRAVTPAAIPLPPSPERPHLMLDPTSDQHNECPPVSERKEDDAKNNENNKTEGVLVESTNTPTLQKVTVQDADTRTPVGLDGAFPALNISCKTPISALLSSIQQGFDMTPCSPLSPPQHYLQSPSPLHDPTAFRIGVVTQQNAPVTSQL